MLIDSITSLHRPQKNAEKIYKIVIIEMVEIMSPYCKDLISRISRSQSQSDKCPEL